MYGTIIFGSEAKSDVKITTVPRNTFVGSIANNEVFVAREGVAQLTKIVSGRVLGNKRRSFLTD